MLWYLDSRGIPIPDCPPLWRTPEPNRVKGAIFDPDRVDRVIRAMGAMKHAQGKWRGRPLKPDPWQVAYILAPVFGWVRRDDEGRFVRIVQLLYVDVPRKNGKGLYTGTMILTRDGWKKFGDLQVGDFVHSVDGSLAAVTYVSPERLLDCYRVTFGDGQQVTCDADHLWTVWDRFGHDPDAWASRPAGVRPKGAWRTVDTPTLFANHRCGARRDTRYSVQMDRAIERPKQDLPLDPYVLGLWLGDGASAAARFTTRDPELVRAFEKAGYTARRVSRTEIEYGISGGLLVALRELGVLNNKHVPESHLLGSADQRLALLQGLMDTDGGVNKSTNTPRVEFMSTNHQLAESVLFLARSLGWKAVMTEKRATLNGVDCGPAWRVTWTAFRDRSPFRLERKTRRLHAWSKRTRSSTNVVTKVERVPSVPTRCIQVDHPSHQFLVGEGLIPTHNTTIAGGLALYLTGGDGEGGSQVVAVAAAKSQASFCFDPVKEIVDGTPGLKRNFRPMRGQILHPRSGSKFSVASSIGELLQGSNPHGAIVDELHVHKTPDVLDAVTSGQGARSQPLTVIITTPDDGRSGTVYDRERRKAEKLAAGVLKDESVYAVLWGAELDDDPFSEATWRKANPGYGVSPSKAFMEREARKAKNSPAELAGFQRLNLGIRTKQQERFIKLPTWDRNAGMVVEDRLAGMKCHGGLDLSSVSDLTALAWVFRDDKTGARTVLLRHWLPEDRLDDLNRRTANAASVWVKEGWLRLTPGEVVDYAFVRHQINEDRARFDVQTLAYDRWNASQLVQELLDDGADMVEMGQGFASMSTPTKELQRLLLQGTSKNPMVIHGANPLLRWEIDNLAVRTDPAGNVKPDKARSGEKIDGVVALVMGLDQDLRHTEIAPFSGKLEVI